MFSATWRRPTEVEFPQTWRTFEKVSKEGKTMKFRIQDITDDWQDEVAEFMTTRYISDELWHSTSGCPSDPVFKEVFNYYVREFVFPQKACTICLMDNDCDEVSTTNGSENKNRPILVGCNLTGIGEKDKEGDYSDLVRCKSAEKLLTIYMEMKKHCPDFYEKYNVDKHMGSFGLAVHPDYRGHSISKEMLLTRIPLCKAFGVKISNTMFTGPASQKVAERAGFLTDACVPYTVLEDALGFKMLQKFEVCKLMTLVIS